MATMTTGNAPLSNGPSRLRLRSGLHMRFKGFSLLLITLYLVLAFLIVFLPQARAASTHRVSSQHRNTNIQGSRQPSRLSSRQQRSRTRRSKTRRVRRSPGWGCWMDIYAGADFAAPTRRIMGPITLPGLNLSDKNWADAIHSVKTGPRAWVRVYKGTNFQGESLLIPPNTSYRSLRPFRFVDAIDSIIVRNRRF